MTKHETGMEEESKDWIQGYIDALVRIDAILICKKPSMLECLDYLQEQIKIARYELKSR